MPGSTRKKSESAYYGAVPRGTGRQILIGKGEDDEGNCLAVRYSVIIYDEVAMD